MWFNTWTKILELVYHVQSIYTSKMIFRAIALLYYISHTGILHVDVGHTLVTKIHVNTATHIVKSYEDYIQGVVQMFLNFILLHVELTPLARTPFTHTVIGQIIVFSFVVMGME